MARSRVINPGFFTNEDLLELPLEARVLFAGLWCLADRMGRMEDRPKRIKIELFPGDNFDVDTLLQALLNKGFIHRYAVPGMNLVHIRHFLKYQRPHPREAQSVLPECPCETEKRDQGQSKDIPRTDLGSAKVSGLGSPKTIGSPRTQKPPPEAIPELKRVTPKYLEEIQPNHPTVNLKEVFADASNRKTWDGYKDQRRAFAKYIGWAEEKVRPQVNGHSPQVFKAEGIFE